MERIVQLRESEYNSIVETAKLNDDEIKKQAEILWRKRGIPELAININFNREERYSLQIGCDVLLFNGRDNFKIPDKARRKFASIIEDYIMRDIDKKFGGAIEASRRYDKETHKLNNLFKISWLVALTGWEAFLCVLYVLYNL